jgi:hypothetical protein
MNMNAVIFVPALVGSVICGFFFLMFAAHYYLTIMESTGVGAKEVTWFSEPILDNAWKVGYMGWLVGLWLGPAYFIGRAATSGTDSEWLRLAIPLAVFWICYPISQLSSLSATSIWYPLVPDVFARLLQKPIVTLGFLLVSIPVLAAFGAGFKWAFLTEGEWKLLFIGAPLLVLSGFMYARLIGRLAFALRFTKSLFPEKKQKKEKPLKPIPPRPEQDPDEVFTQPSDLPPIQTPYDGDLSGYDVKFEGTPAPRPKKRLKAEVIESESDSEEADSPYRLEPDEEPAPTPKAPSQKSKRQPPPIAAIERSRVWSDEDDDEATSYEVRAPELVPVEEKKKVVQEKPLEEEMKLLRREDVPKRPKVIWGPELLVFLAQSATVSAWLIASGLCGMAGVMVRVARMFNPVAGASD